MPVKRFEFRLSIPREKYLDYYRGTARDVVVHLSDGQTMQFPASLLVKFVTSTGVHGDFVLTCDDDFKNAELQRLPARP